MTQQHLKGLVERMEKQDTEHRESVRNLRAREEASQRDTSRSYHAARERASGTHAGTYASAYRDAEAGADDDRADRDRSASRVVCRYWDGTEGSCQVHAACRMPHTACRIPHAGDNRHVSLSLA
jgi:hypothetical protein